MFSTESKYGDLLVVILPSNPPVIMGGQAEYSPGDFVHLNCSSYDSKPAADLTWRINGQNVGTFNKNRDLKITTRLCKVGTGLLSSGQLSPQSELALWLEELY